MKKSLLRLQGAIQIPTCSHPNPKDTNWDYFKEFISYLEKSYPQLHQSLPRTLVNDYSLVFHWHSKNPEQEPVLLTAHYDVVAASDKGWEHPAFSGFDDGEKIWGRGTLDDKSSLISILEAIEMLLEDGFIPERDIYFAFGFDEEQGGALGAQQIAKHFKEAGIQFKFLLDEGGAIVDGSMMGVSPDLAVVGIAEKGNNSFRFTFRGEEGHSSTPPKHSAIGIMADFIRQVENNPMPLHMTETVEEMLKAIAPYKKGIAGFLLNHPRTFAPIIQKILLKNKQTAAMLRSTVAFTMSEAGSGHNVLPMESSCVANVRILQGDSVTSVKEYFQSFGFEYEIEPLLENEPTGISDVHSSEMKYISDCISANFNNTVPLPYLMVGGTDSRYYHEVAKQTFRFLPCRLTAEELGTMHATNEYISHQNFENMIRFYRYVIENIK